MPCACACACKMYYVAGPGGALLLVTVPPITDSDTVRRGKKRIRVKTRRLLAQAKDKRIALKQNET